MIVLDLVHLQNNADMPVSCYNKVGRSSFNSPVSRIVNLHILLYIHTSIQYSVLCTVVYSICVQLQSTEHYLYKVTLHSQRSVKRHLRL